MSLETLAARYPLPSERPDKKPFYWSLDGGGREIIQDLIRERDVRLMAEVGVFLGGSTIQWLDAKQDLTVIGVDPWDLGDRLPDYFERSADIYSGERLVYSEGLDRKSLRKQLIGPESFYQCALSNLWNYRDRFIAMRNKSPQALYEISDHGVMPELVYIDSDKNGEELEVIRELFPEAIISGDDWLWGADKGFPIQKAVRPFAERHGLEIVSKAASWYLR